MKKNIKISLSLFFILFLSGCGAVMQNSIAVREDGKMAICLTSEGNYKAITFGGKKTKTGYDIPPDRGDIYITDTLASQLKKITNDDNPKGFMQWAKDGQRLLYLESYASNSYVLKLINEDGTNGRTLLEKREIHFPILSPDGKRVAYFSKLEKGPDASSALYALDVASGKSKRISSKAFASLIYPTVVWLDNERVVALEVRSDEIDNAFKAALVIIDMQGQSFELARGFFYSEAFLFGLLKEKGILLFNALDMANLGAKGNRLKMLKVRSYDFSNRKVSAPPEFDGYIMVNTWTIPSECVLVKRDSASVIDDVVDSLSSAKEGKEALAFSNATPLPVKLFGYPFLIGKDETGYIHPEMNEADFSSIWFAKKDGSSKESFTDKVKEKLK